MKIVIRNIMCEMAGDPKKSIWMCSHLPIFWPISLFPHFCMPFPEFSTFWRKIWEGYFWWVRGKKSHVCRIYALGFPAGNFIQFQLCFLPEKQVKPRSFEDYENFNTFLKKNPWMIKMLKRELVFHVGFTKFPAVIMTLKN